MSAGRLIAVVGPSGVGKDTVIKSLIQAAPDFRRVRRIITRDPDPDGEDHHAVTQQAFAAAQKAGEFCIDWCAHGYRYAIPASTLDDVNAGFQCVANFSRTALTAAADVFPALTVLSITADTQILAKRLNQRARENASDIAARLERASIIIPAGIDAYEIHNDGPVEETVKNVLQVLRFTQYQNTDKQ